MKYLVALSVIQFICGLFAYAASISSSQDIVEEYIKCYYNGGIDGTKYECILSINNPNGIEFTEIDGHHLPRKQDEDVTIVTAYSGTSKTIPSIICRTFPNIFYLSIISINVEELTTSAFENCHNLVDLTLSFNKIAAVPANLFINNPKLKFIDLSGNQISELDENSFTGTAISSILLDFNEFKHFNQNWFTSINATLRHLEVIHNIITELEDHAFG